MSFYFAKGLLPVCKWENCLCMQSAPPLPLGFALTIHKCQGMTLSNVLVDCRGAFDLGQISVALGRVRYPQDITVFRKGLCPPHPPLWGFYGIAFATSSLDLSCCKRVSNPSQSGHSYRPDDMLEDNHHSPVKWRRRLQTENKSFWRK